VLVVVNASALRADRDAASGVDDACVQRTFAVARWPITNG